MTFKRTSLWKLFLTLWYYLFLSPMAIGTDNSSFFSSRQELSEQVSWGGGGGDQGRESCLWCVLLVVGCALSCISSEHRHLCWICLESFNCVAIVISFFNIRLSGQKTRGCWAQSNFINFGGAINPGLFLYWLISMRTDSTDVTDLKIFFRNYALDWTMELTLDTCVHIFGNWVFFLATIDYSCMYMYFIFYLVSLLFLH